MTRYLSPLTAVLALALSAPAALASDPQPVNSQMTFSGTPFQVAGLDAGVTWGRQDVPGEGCCSSDLSLISDNTQPDSFAYPFVTTINDTTSPAATQDSSQSTGVNVRAYNSSTGSPWLAGVHSEAWHGYAYPSQATSQAAGTTLAYNAEIHRASPSGLVIGLELNGLGPLPGDDAIRLEGTWKMGIELGSNDLHARDVTASNVEAATSVSAGAIHAGTVSASVVSATTAVSSRRFVLAPGVWIDYEHGRVLVHRHGRIVARW